MKRALVTDVRTGVAGLAVMVVVVVGCAAALRHSDDPLRVAGRKVISGFDHPEDVQVIASRGVALVSSMGDAEHAGFLSIVPLDLLGNPPQTPPQKIDGTVLAELAQDAPSPCECVRPRVLHPHGIDAVTVNGIVRVAVVNHAHDATEQESVLLFDLTGSGRDATLHWVGCIPFGPGVYGNDVALDEAGAVYITNSRSYPEGLRSTVQQVLARYFDKPTGDVRTIAHPLEPPVERPTDAGCAWVPLQGSEARFATGIAVSPHGGRLFVSEGMGDDVLVLARHENEDRVTTVTHIPLAGGPDNISWDGDRLLVAVHTDPGAFISCVLANKKTAEDCSSPWAVLAIDPWWDCGEDRKGPAAKVPPPEPRCIVCGDGRDLGGVSSASADGNALLLGATFGRSIAKQDLPEDRSTSRCPCQWNGAAPIPTPTPCPSPDRKRDWARASAPPAAPTRPCAARTPRPDRR